MKLEPIITEKSMKGAGYGKYTFLVDRNLDKHKIKKLVEETFGVEVVQVRTSKVPGQRRRTIQGRYRTIPTRKKVVVTLKEKQKIDLFEERKK